MEALLAYAEPRWGSGRVMRPNRDVRFSADKSPYRLSASMWASGGREALEALQGRGFEVAGPSLSTAPKGYARNHPEIELLRLRHYAAVQHLPVSATLGEIDDAWSAVAPLTSWVERHVGPAESWP